MSAAARNEAGRLALNAVKPNVAASTLAARPNLRAVGLRLRLSANLQKPLCLRCAALKQVGWR